MQILLLQKQMGPVVSTQTQPEAQSALVVQLTQPTPEKFEQYGVPSTSVMQWQLEDAEPGQGDQTPSRQMFLPAAQPSLLVHLPFLQLNAPAHRLLHRPQWFLSALVLTHLPPHCVRLPRQRQRPAFVLEPPMHLAPAQHCRRFGPAHAFLPGLTQAAAAFSIPI